MVEKYNNRKYPYDKRIALKHDHNYAEQ